MPANLSPLGNPPRHPPITATSSLFGRPSFWGEIELIMGAATAAVAAKLAHEWRSIGKVSNKTFVAGNLVFWGLVNASRAHSNAQRTAESMQISRVRAKKDGHSEEDLESVLGAIQLHGAGVSRNIRDEFWRGLMATGAATVNIIRDSIVPTDELKQTRQQWLKRTLTAVPARIMGPIAMVLYMRAYATHLEAKEAAIKKDIAVMHTADPSKLAPDLPASFPMSPTVLASMTFGVYALTAGLAAAFPGQASTLFSVSFGLQSLTVSGLYATNIMFSGTHRTVRGEDAPADQITGLTRGIRGLCASFSLPAALVASMSGVPTTGVASMISTMASKIIVRLNFAEFLSYAVRDKMEVYQLQEERVKLDAEVAGKEPPEPSISSKIYRQMLKGPSYIPDVTSMEEAWSLSVEHILPRR